MNFLEMMKNSNWTGNHLERLHSVVPTEGHSPLVVHCVSYYRPEPHWQQKWNTYCTWDVRLLQAYSLPNMPQTSLTLHISDTLHHTCVWPYGLLWMLSLTHSQWLINSVLSLSPSLSLCFACILNLLSFCHTHLCSHHSNLSVTTPPLSLYFFPFFFLSSFSLPWCLSTDLSGL